MMNIGGNMKKIVVMLMLGLTTTFAQAVQTFYYEQPATLTGKILVIKSLHFNQEDFGGNQIAIALDRQVHVDGEEGLVKTKLIQLVDTNEKRYQQYFRSNNKRITVKCNSLFRAHTAHHSTKVLCMVESSHYRR